MARKDGKDRGITRRKGLDGWWVRITQNGREHWHKCDTKSQATALYGRLKADIREGIYFPEKFKQSKDITLRAWIARYLEGSTNRSLRNERRYGRFWRLLIGKRLLSQITTEDLRRIQSKLKARGEKTKPDWTKMKGAKGPATINRHFAFLRHLLMLAVKDGKLTRNPVSGLKFFPEARRTRFFSDDELKNLKNVLPEAEWKLVVFAIETGLRQEEQFRLRWDQVNFDSGAHGILTIPLSKGGRTRHVPLTPYAAQTLRSLDSLFLGSPWVFPARKLERPRSQTSFMVNLYTPALKKAGITGACWHTLRHTAASRRIMAGVDLFSVKELLGHRDIQTTMRYAHLAPGHLEAAVNKGSLNPTVTATVTKGKKADATETQQPAEVLEG